MGEIKINVYFRMSKSERYKQFMTSEDAGFTLRRGIIYLIDKI